MANLLSYKESFVWEDSVIDRGVQIQELNIALDRARDLGDDIFKVPDLFNINLSWGDFFEFVYDTAFDDHARQLRFPWLSQAQHQTLIALLHFFSNATPRPSNNVQDLNEEYPDQSNSLIGIYSDQLPEDYVYDEETWSDLHRRWVTLFSRNERNRQRKYFRRFFYPELLEDPNRINYMIKKGQVHSFFKRIDIPKFGGDGNPLHGEQVQIHFNDKGKSALNIDGTWKHGECKIPEAACEQLIEWGFLLPDDI
ncbi:MAG: hypothetical protein QM731_20905 [Chitinophagaceae bacterium]